MNVINNLVIPMPRISTLQVVGRLTIKVAWAAGIRSGRTDVVDLSSMVNSIRLYRPIRDNHELFQTAHLIEDGQVVAWGDDDQIDMAADSVEELAEETMTPDDLRDFLNANNLTHNEAAERLGRSRRQIENYLSGSEPIPRVVVMACFGLIARKKQLLRGSVTKIRGVIDPTFGNYTEAPGGILTVHRGTEALATSGF